MSDSNAVCNKCVTCGKEYSSDEIICPEDGGLLVAAKKDPAVGTIIAEKYEILEVLGGGGMGVVYKAKHLLMHRTVAIKMLLEETVSNEYALARFQKEAQAASSLNHPNILTIFDFGISEKRPYLVMDYLKGQTLAEVLQKEDYLHLQRALSIYIQIASALAHAHQNGVIHRDLKPANIMLVEYEGQGDFVKIVDFGIAKTIHGGGEGASIELTQTGQVFGSPLYMSPEQCRGGHLDARADIYSLGCVMYRSSTGKSPFAGQDALELMYKHVNASAPKFAECCPELKLPQNFEDVVMKCLEKEVDNRYQTMLELRKDLERIAGTSINSPFIFPAGEIDASKTPAMGSLEQDRETLNQIIALTESQKQAASEVAAAQEKRKKEKEALAHGHILSATEQTQITKSLESKATTASTDASAATTGHGSSASTSASTPAQTASPTAAEIGTSTQSTRTKTQFERSKVLLIGAFAALLLIPAVAMMLRPSHNDKSGPNQLPMAVTSQPESKAGDELRKGSDAYNAGKYVDAKDALQRAISLATLDKNSTVKFEALALLGQIDVAEGNLDSAKSSFYTIITAYNTETDPKAKPSDTQAAVAFNGLGVVETNQGIYKRAGDHLKKALSLRQKLPSKDSDIHETLMAMGTLALYEAKYTEALNDFSSAKTTSEQINGPDHTDTANILNDMGQAYQFLKKYSEADACYKQALAIRKKKLQPNDPSIASTEMCMAALAFQRRDFGTSEKLFQDALAIDTKSLGTDNLVVAQIYFSLGVLYQQQKRFDQAADYYQKALAIRQAKLDPGDQKIAHTKALLEQVKKRFR